MTRTRRRSGGRRTEEAGERRTEEAGERRTEKFQLTRGKQQSRRLALAQGRAAQWWAEYSRVTRQRGRAWMEDD